MKAHLGLGAAIMVAFLAGAAALPPPTIVDFAQGAGDWKTFNYESRVSFAVTNLEGISGFAAFVPGVKPPVVPGEKIKVPDTAWGLVSPLISVEPDLGFAFTLKVRSTVNAQRPGGDESSSCFLSFYDDQGEELADYIPLGLVNASNVWQCVESYGRIPAGARKMQIHLGADGPDLGPGDSIVLSQLKLTWYPKGPEAANRVTLRDDGCVLVGGKPFFPIGIYNVNANPHNGNDLKNGMRELKAAGINLVHTYFVSRDGTLQRFMAAAEEAGLKVWVPAGGSNAEFHEKFLLMDRAHPALLTWYLADDTASSVKASEIFRRHYRCHALDPDHITVHADYLSGRRSSRYLDYVNASDGFMPEIYTVFAKAATGREVSDIFRDMNTVKTSIRQQGSPMKTIWPIIQYFEGWRDWNRYPTAKELRAMTFAALVSGVNGLIFYTYDDTADERGDGWGGNGVAHSREHFDTFAAVTREVAGLSRHLVSRDAAVQPQVKIISGPRKDPGGTPSIHCLLKETGLLMAVNSANEEVVAQVRLPGDERSATLRLEPLGVRIGSLMSASHF